MKAAVLRAPDAVPEYAEFADPDPQAGYETVDLVAAGLHPIVRALASGGHYGSCGAYPMIPGVDAVARTREGTMVYTGLVRPPYGTFSERMAVPERMRFPLPPNADPVKIASGINPGLSSWMPLKARATELGALGTVLILGVTGMAGLLGVQNARLLGARSVIGAGRNPGALEHAEELGATTIALTGEKENDAKALARALDGAQPSIVLDYLWGSVAEAAFGALARRGLEEDTANIAYVQVGAMAGTDAALPAQLLRSRRIVISGSGAGAASIAEVIAQVPIYMQLIGDEKVVVSTQTFKLSSIAQAWTALSERARIVVVP